MSHAGLSRVPLLAPLLLLLLWVCGALPHSCHEVKTAFQQRQIGAPKLVPDTPAADADLQICRHMGPTCCTRKMEESYQAAVRREITENIRSYSFELKYHISSLAIRFQETFQSLVATARNNTLNMIGTTYKPLAAEAHDLVSELFTDLSLHLHGADMSVELAINRFYDGLFPLVYGRLVNPGLATPTPERAECLRATRRDVNPFGPHPGMLLGELKRALRLSQVLERALGVGANALNATEHASLSRECSRALVRMQYCPHCRGLTLIRPCVGFCLNVMRGCLAGLSELDGPWKRYLSALEAITDGLAGAHDLEMVLRRMHDHVNDAILYTQLHGPRLSATVDKVCGELPEVMPATSPRPLPKVTTPSTSMTPVTSSQQPADPQTENSQGSLVYIRSSFPLKPSSSDKPTSLKKINREFMGHIQRYKSFYAALPEILCDGEMVVEDFSCWSGEDVVESYSGRIVGNGLQAQRLNPEVKVRSVDPSLVEAINKLEHFNREIRGTVPQLMDRIKWSDDASGEMESSGDCDDEDGCQGSGDGATGPRFRISQQGPSVGKEPVSGTAYRPLPPRLDTKSSVIRPTASGTLVFTFLLLCILVLHWDLV